MNGVVLLVRGRLDCNFDSNIIFVYNLIFPLFIDSQTDEISIFFHSVYYCHNFI